MRKRILLVDDEKNIRLVMQISLARLGTYEIDVADSGPEALGKLGAQHFDLIITDLKLSPNMDGLELIRRTRHLGLNPLFILISGFPNELVEAQVRGLDIQGYLAKPFLREALISMVQRLLEDRVTD